MKKIYLIVICLSIIAYTPNLFAQDEEESSPVEFSGSIDAYYRANLSARNTDEGPGYIAPATSFANYPGFALGMVNLIASKEFGDVGFVADLVFGPRGTDAVFLSNGSSSIVNQLYAYWNVSDNVTLTMGNFNTFLGYEVISPVDNFNYSTSYMFSYGPFSHTGLKADFTLSENLSLMLGVFNPTDFTEFNPYASYSLGAQLGYSGDGGSIYLNFLYGDQDGKLDEMSATTGDYSAGSLFQVDVTTGWDLTDMVYFGLNATVNSTGAGELFNGTSISDVDEDSYGFYGVAGYLQLSPSETFSIGTRIEYFGETNFGYGIIGAYDGDGKASIIDVTLTGKVTIGDHLTLIPEFRLDSGSEDGTFIDKDFANSKSLSSVLLAAVFAF